MKITHFIFSLPNAGQENLLVDIANRQVSENEVYIVIINNIVDENVIKRLSKNVFVKRINRKKHSKSLIPFFKLIFFILKSRPDILHFHEIDLIRFFPLKYIQKRSVITVHNTGLYNNILEKYSIIFAISESVKKYILAKGGKKFKNKIITNYNGIDFSNLRIKNNFILNDTFKIVQISRLDIHQKGQDILLKALKIVKEKYEIPFTCEFIGVGADLELIMKLTDELGLQNEIIFSGNKDRTWVYNNLQKYNVLIQPSRFEGFGLTVIEGMGAKVPVICSNIEGPSEILEEGKFGFMFDSLDSEMLADKIGSVYNLYKEKLIEKYVNTSYIHAIQNFSIENTVANYIRSYKLIK